MRVDFDHDYMDEARRYYCNIVGKYGQQTAALLKRWRALDVQMICPLHGHVWRKDLSVYIDKYEKWSSYTPEDKGVYVSPTPRSTATPKNAAEILSCKCKRAASAP
jgi:flavorubredoxin